MTEAPATRLDPLPDFLRQEGLHAVLAALPRARMVGGCVRDALLHRDVADIDLATPDAPEDVMAALRAAGLKAVPTGLAHGTVTAVAAHRGFEVTTLRQDVATDGRHAVVAFTADWRADAARRDFTINAMSMTADGAVFDYFAGLADLAAGRVRFVGDAATRIAEDYLRVLRFFRFHARYGRGAPDPQALAAIRAGVPGLARLSAERVWSELKRILAGPNPAGTVALMRETGVLQAVLPEAGDEGALRRAVDAGMPQDPVWRLAALLPRDAAGADAVARRLKLSNAARALLIAITQVTAPDDNADDDALRRDLADIWRDVLVARCWIDGRSEDVRRRLEAMPIPVFPVGGHDVARFGYPPGPAMGAILAQLREKWLAEGCRAGRDEVLGWL